LAQNAAGERFEVVHRAGRGELEELLRRRIVDALVATKAARYQFGAARAAPVADSAEHDATQAVRMLCGGLQTDPRSHRVAEVVGAFEPEVVEKADNVAGHGPQPVCGRVVGLLRAAVPSAVEAQHAPAGAGQ